jgi:hypothetical protein
VKFVHSMKGLGDNVYMRAFIKALGGKIVIDTPWPQLYSDLPNVECVKPTAMKLRTQAKNVAAYKGWNPKRHTPRSTVGYKPSYREEGIYNGMRQAFQCDAAPMDLPAAMHEPLDGFEPGRYVVVRPVTVRAEWRADSRNPDPHYIAQAATAAMNAGYRVVSVADLMPDHEWMIQPGPPCHTRLHHGELNVIQLMRLVANAAYCIGGIGWIVPACMATGTPALIICGGQGGYNSPHHLMVPGNDAMIKYVVPDNFCMCREKQHECDKTVTGMGQILRDWDTLRR